MSGLLVLAALWPEVALLRLAAPAQVVRTGMGRRSAATLPLVRDSAAGAVAVAGFCGALAPGVQAGDVVVATEVRSPDGTVVGCPSAPVLVAALRRAGLQTHLGPLATTASLVTGRQRTDLAATGALAVDMESGPLLAAAGERPVAAVRVVVDTPAAELTSPRLLPGLLPAARALRRIGPALDAWAAATGPRQVVLAVVGESPAEAAVAPAQVDLLLVTGPANSSKSLRLVEVARRAGCAAHLVKDATHIDPAWLAGVRRVGLTAGASAPPHLVGGLQAALAGLGPVDVITRTTSDETVHPLREVS